MAPGGERGAASIYKGLATWLKSTYSSDSVFELDLTRWISLEDRILDRAPVFVEEPDELKSLTFSIETDEPETDDIQYVPFVFPLDQGAIKKWIRHHSTTVLDIYMRRAPSENVFRVFTV